MAIAIGEVKPGFLADDQGNGTLIPLPPPNGGALGWGPVWVSFGSDFGDVVLRVAVFNSSTNAWRITDRVTVPAQGDRVNIGIQDGDQKVSVGRVSSGPGDTGRWPCGWVIETTLKAAP